MRTLFIIPLVLMSLVSFPSWGLTLGDLVQRDGLYYKKFTDVPFTGKIDDGLERGNYKSGRREGSWTIYRDNGQLKQKGEYKNGKKEGTWVSYYNNGQLKSNYEYKNNKLEGTSVNYYDNGQLHMKGDFKNSKTEGPWVFYHENGQLFKKGNFKNDKREGPWVFFKRDGTKRISEKGYGDEGSGLYRDDKKVSD